MLYGIILNIKVVYSKLRYVGKGSLENTMAGSILFRKYFRKRVSNEYRIEVNVSAKDYNSYIIFHMTHSYVQGMERRFRVADS